MYEFFFLNDDPFMLSLNIDKLRSITNIMMYASCSCTKYESVYIVQFTMSLFCVLLSNLSTNICFQERSQIVGIYPSLSLIK